MTAKKFFLAFVATALTCGLLTDAFGADTVPAHIAAAINSIARSDYDRMLDTERKPAEVLAFAEVKPGDAVAELDDPFYELAADDTYANGFTYWTRLLSMAVGKQGHMYPMVSTRGYRGSGPMRTAMEKAAAAAGKPKPFDPAMANIAVAFQSEFKNVKPMAEMLELYGGDFALPEQADVVFIRDAYHDFHNSVPSWGLPPFSKPYNMTLINRAIYRAMKPGAVLLVSDYASAPGAGFSVTESLKRSDPESVKAEVMAVGFEFVGASNALADPADDRGKPAAGLLHPDQFLLKFRKPRNAPDTNWRPSAPLLAKWLRNWANNTITTLPPWQVGNFYDGQWYRADGRLEEWCCGLAGNRPNGGVLLSSYFWDAEGHACQYFEHPTEPRPGDAVCHSLETPEARNAEPGGYAYAALEGWPDVQAATKALRKGVVFPAPVPANRAELFAARPKSNTIPLGPNPGKIWGAPAPPNPRGLSNFYCRIDDGANSTAYFSNVLLGDFGQSARYAAAFGEWVRGQYPGSQGNATCLAQTNDFRQTRAKEDIDRTAADKAFKVREDTGWYYTLDGAFGFR